MSDAVFGGVLGTTATDIQLTTAWNVNAAYEHFWNPRWRTSLYGGYAAVSYNNSARRVLFSLTQPTPTDFDMNWSTWWLGSRTQWNVTKDFYMGLDVMYARLHTASEPGGILPSGVVIGGATAQGDADNWQFRLRVHRDFYP